MITALNTITNRFRLLEGTTADITAASGLRGDIVFCTDAGEEEPQVYVCVRDGGAYEPMSAASATGGSSLLEVEDVPAEPTTNPEVTFRVVRWTNADRDTVHSEGYWSGTAQRYVSTWNDLLTPNP